MTTRTYTYIANSGVTVHSTVEPHFDTVLGALWGEYARWTKRFLGRGK